MSYVGLPEGTYCILCVTLWCHQRWLAGKSLNWMEVSSSENHWFLWSIFQQAMFDYRRTGGYWFFFIPASYTQWRIITGPVAIHPVIKHGTEFDELPMKRKHNSICRWCPISSFDLPEGISTSAIHTSQCYQPTKVALGTVFIGELAHLQNPTRAPPMRKQRLRFPWIGCLKQPGDPEEFQDQQGRRHQTPSILGDRA